MKEIQPSNRTGRREFCAACGKAAGLAALTAVAACSSGSSPTSPGGVAQALPTVQASVSGRTVSVSLTANSPLANNGGMAITQTSLGNFLLSRTDANTVSVLTAVCTHEGETVSGYSGSQFVCPGHGAIFSTSGAVVRGPANRSLRQYTSQVSGDTVTFTA